MKLIVNRGNFYYCYPEAETAGNAIVSNAIKLVTSSGVINIDTGMISMPKKGELEWQQQ